MVALNASYRLKADQETTASDDIEQDIEDLKLLIRHANPQRQKILETRLALKKTQLEDWK